MISFPIKVDSCDIYCTLVTSKYPRNQQHEGSPEVRTPSWNQEGSLLRRLGAVSQYRCLVVLDRVSCSTVAVLNMRDGDYSVVEYLLCMSETLGSSLSKKNYFRPRHNGSCL